MTEPSFQASGSLVSLKFRSPWEAQDAACPIVPTLRVIPKSDRSKETFILSNAANTSSRYKLSLFALLIEPLTILPLTTATRHSLLVHCMLDIPSDTHAPLIPCTLQILHLVGRLQVSSIAQEQAKFPVPFGQSTAITSIHWRAA